MGPEKNNLTRRRVLQSSIYGLGLIGSPMTLKYALAQSRRIVVRDDGGIYSKAFGAVYYRPFTEKTGIEVIGAQAVAEPVEQIKNMVDSGTYTWDMAKISQPAILLLTAGKKKYLELHGLENDLVIKSIPAKFMSPYGVGTNVYSTVLAYRAEAFTENKAPQSWADFWDIKNFPGTRSLRKHPFDTLEEAVMATGVSADRVYPINIDRALKSLDKIKKYINVWWGTGAQIEQMFRTGEVDMIATWVARPQSAIANGAKVEIIWNQNLWGVDNWCILAGGPNMDICREFIKFASEPKRMAMLFDYFPAGVTQPSAFDYVATEKAQYSPSYPDNLEQGLQIDADYWQANQAAAIRKFNDWVSA